MFSYLSCWTDGPWQQLLFCLLTFFGLFLITHQKINGFIKLSVYLSHFHPFSNITKLLTTPFRSQHNTQISPYSRKRYWLLRHRITTTRRHSQLKQSLRTLHLSLQKLLLEAPESTRGHNTQICAQTCAVAIDLNAPQNSNVDNFQETCFWRSTAAFQNV